MSANNFEEVTLKKGESTEIKLKGLATAGYKWKYNIDANKDIINITKDFVLAGNTAGASADEVFTIKAEEKGTVNITFFQTRGWEKNAEPVNTKVVRLVIE